MLRPCRRSSFGAAAGRRYIILWRSKLAPLFARPLHRRQRGGLERYLGLGFPEQFLEAVKHITGLLPPKTRLVGPQLAADHERSGGALRPQQIAVVRVYRFPQHASRPPNAKPTTVL